VSKLAILYITMDILGDQTRVNSSVLDRLIGGPSEPGDSMSSRRLHSVGGLKAAIWRDLSALLNTRRMEHPISPEFEQCNSSLLIFGLPDFSLLSLRSPGDQRRLGLEIETAIRMFEPRLSGVSVTAEPRNELDSTLRFRVEALLEIEPAPELITFDTILEGDTGKFSVTGKNK